MSNSQEKNILSECISYFKSNPGYHRIFLEMRRQWKKYGKIAGYIILKEATAEERNTIQGLLGRPVEDDKLKFKMAEFQQALDETKFAGVTLSALLAGYFRETLSTNKTEREKILQDKAKFFQEVEEALIHQKQNTDAVMGWLRVLVDQKSMGYQLVIAEYGIDRDRTKNMLVYVCKAVNYLSEQDTAIRLAVLGAKITTDPHYFDRAKTAGKLLVYVLCHVNTCQYPADSEQILELYYQSGIKPDDISSFTVAYGIRLCTEKGEHSAYAHFIKEREQYVLTLSNLNRIIKADCESKKVFIVENQMVFSQLCENMADMDVSLICTSGQMKTASLVLIDLLCKSGCTLYYSGDIDPEGILIADAVIRRGNGKVVPWCFEVEDYYASVSDKVVEEISLKKLVKIQEPTLKKVAVEVMKKKTAGYQELLLEKMQEDILRIIQ